MKYIIDLPEDQQIMFMDGKHMSVITPQNGEISVFDAEACENNLVKLKPYDESEAEQCGADKAWKLACHLYNLSPDVTEAIYWSMNGGKGLGVALEMPYAEAQAEYDAWQKRKNEIHVGDEVDRNGIKGVVCWIGEDDVCGICPDVWNDQTFITFRWDKNETLKTGRKFPELAEMFEKMKEPE